MPPKKARDTCGDCEKAASPQPLGRSVGSGVITIPPFISVPVAFYKVEKTERLKLHTICECGLAPKQGIACKCGKSYGASWSNVPNRVFDARGGIKVVLTKEERDKAESANVHDDMKVEGLVDFQPLAAQFVLGDPIYLVPSKEAVKVQRDLYEALNEDLTVRNKALLTRATISGRSKRLAIVPSGKGLLRAYEVTDAVPVAEEGTPAEVPAATLAQVEALLAPFDKKGDITFPPEPDPLEGLISEKVEAAIKAASDKKPQAAEAQVEAAVSVPPPSESAAH